MLKKALLLSLLVAALAHLTGQNTQNEVQSAFNKAESELVLLKNAGNLIPLRRLDTLKIACLTLGFGQKTDFVQTLQKYMPVDIINLPVNATGTSQRWAEDLGERYNLVILGINDDGNTIQYQQQEATLKALFAQTTTIAVILGRNEAFQATSIWSNADALIVTPPNDYAPSLAAQAVFGAIGIGGKSKVAYGAYPVGSGLKTQSINRLRYSPAAMAGMNAQLLEDSIKAILMEGIDAGAFPGAQVLVAKDGHVVYHQAFGYHTFDNEKAVSTRDIYDFASVSKVTSALPAVMKLYGEDRFDLDAPLKQYFPKIKRSNKSDLTYREMLAHYARLRPWIPYWRGTLKGNGKYPWKKSWDNDVLNEGKFRRKTFQRDSSEKYPIKITDDLWLYKDFKDKTIYKSIRKSPLREKKEYVYSGLLFYLLPEIVADLTQTDYETYLNQNFYHKLGAYTLTYNPYRFFPLDRIVPTERDTFFRMVQLHGRVHDEGAAMMGGVSANAGLFGSANDLAKLMTMYMNWGAYGGEQLIGKGPEQLIAEKALKERFRQVLVTRCPEYCEEGWGFGPEFIGTV